MKGNAPNRGRGVGAGRGEGGVDQWEEGGEGVREKFRNLQVAGGEGGGFQEGTTIYNLYIYSNQYIGGNVCTYVGCLGGDQHHI